MAILLPKASKKLSGEFFLKKFIFHSFLLDRYEKNALCDGVGFACGGVATR
ncbi:MAG: hypothetical protein ACR2NY_02825 [Alphaproteobacteria bacterium]